MAKCQGIFDTPVRQHLRRAFSHHKASAKWRGIPFRLTFEEWLDIWTSSGHLSERGCRVGEYVMARLGDRGAYELGNVQIITNTENLRQYGRANGWEVGTRKPVRKPRVRTIRATAACGIEWEITFVDGVAQ
jgi:hypothetical protein